MELTVPFELGSDKTHIYKTEKYTPLITDIQNNGFDVVFLAIEIVSSENMTRLKTFLSGLDEKGTKPREFRDKRGKMALVSSFAIYCAKDEPSWQEFNLL